MGEVWAQIQGFENYAVSDQGRVMNTKTGRIKTANYSHEKEYARVKLTDGTGKQSYQRLHRLVALHHIPNPTSKPTVNHKEGLQKWNNAVTNLEWMTQKEQIEHAIKTGLFHRNKAALS